MTKFHGLLLVLATITGRIASISSTHATAKVSTTAVLKDNVNVLAGTEIRDGCQIGENCTLGKNCILDNDVKLEFSVKVGNDSFLGQKVSVKDYARIGNNVYIGDGVEIGASSYVMTGAIVYPYSRIVDEARVESYEAVIPSVTTLTLIKFATTLPDRPLADAIEIANKNDVEFNSAMTKGLGKIATNLLMNCANNNIDFEDSKSYFIAYIIRTVTLDHYTKMLENLSPQPGNKLNDEYQMTHFNPDQKSVLNEEARNEALKVLAIFPESRRTPETRRNNVGFCENVKKIVDGTRVVKTAVTELPLWRTIKRERDPSTSYAISEKRI